MDGEEDVREQAVKRIERKRLFHMRAFIGAAVAATFGRLPSAFSSVPVSTESGAATATLIEFAGVEKGGVEKGVSQRARSIDYG
ncbi:MAG: hypothetical protein ACLQMH_16420 [Solirubrobacteraceae bacterium]